MDVYVSRIFEGTLLTPTKGTPSAQNCLPMFSPDGTRLAFTSNRDGNPEIYVMNVDGIGLAAPDQSPAHRHDADLVADRHADRVHLGSQRRAVGLRRSASTAWAFAG